jgi:hypothetical protein
MYPQFLLNLSMNPSDSSGIVTKPTGEALRERARWARTLTSASVCPRKILIPVLKFLVILILPETYTKIIIITHKLSVNPI